MNSKKILIDGSQLANRNTSMTVVILQLIRKYSFSGNVFVAMPSILEEEVTSRAKRVADLSFSLGCNNHKLYDYVVFPHEKGFSSKPYTCVFHDARHLRDFRFPGVLRFVAFYSLVFSSILFAKKVNVVGKDEYNFLKKIGLTKIETFGYDDDIIRSKFSNDFQIELIKSEIPSLFSLSKKYKNIVVNIGEIRRHKNQLQLVIQAALFPNTLFVFIGNIVDKEYWNEIQKNSSVNCMFFQGLSNLAIEYFYMHCSAFVQISQKEGFSLTLDEAKSFSKPIIVSDISAHRRLSSYDNAKFVNLKNLMEELSFTLENTL